MWRGTEDLSVSAAPGSGQRVLVIDNLDSFTGSIVQYLQLLGASVTCVRADEVGRTAGYDLVVLSPGPGRPEDFPVNLALLADPPGPVFGVCLGMQALALACGGEVGPAPRVVHGRTSPVHHGGAGVFAGLPSPFRATRYHSLCAVRASLPASLEVTAWVEDGTVMGLRHRTLPLEGVQFHPESVVSEHGLQLFANALSRRGSPGAPSARRP